MLRDGAYYYTILTICYLVIYFGGIGILARMWRKDAKEAAKQKEKE